MAFDDLRSFLKALDEQGQLIEIDEEVLPEPDSLTGVHEQTRGGRSA
ncbi:hypothetical protein [Pantoea stewartii]